MILLKDECYAFPEIKIAANHHDTNIRYWYIVLLRKRWNKSYSGKYTQASKDSRGDREKEISDSHQKNLSMTNFLNTLLKGTGRTDIQETEICGQDNPY